MTKQQLDYQLLREEANRQLLNIRMATEQIVKISREIRQTEDARDALEERALALWRQLSDTERAELWEVE